MYARLTSYKDDSPPQLSQQPVHMPGRWLTTAVVSRSFSWARWGLWGPVPTVTVLKKGSSLELAGSDLWLTFQDSSIFRITTGRLSGAPDTLHCPLFNLFDPKVSAVCCWEHPLFAESCLLYLLTLHSSYFKYLLHPHREGEPIRRCWPEEEEFGSEVLSAGQQQILARHGQEAELSTSG